jgi:hypothetical protein
VKPRPDRGEEDQITLLEPPRAHGIVEGERTVPPVLPNLSINEGLVGAGSSFKK